MAQPTDFATSNSGGVDPTLYYIAVASVTPETPAPPFQLGTQVFANFGSEFVFVQASTSISLGDFLAINNAGQANSLTTTNVQSSLGCRIGMAAATVKQSVTFIPAGAFFWAQTRGSNCSGNAASLISTASPQVQLWTSATAGAVTSVSGAVPILGVEVITSTSLSPNPVFMLTWPRTDVVIGATVGANV